MKVKELPDWLTFSQASDYKNISRQTLYQWKDQKRITIKQGENGVFLIKNDKKFQKIKAEGNRKRRDLLMERIDQLEDIIESLVKSDPPNDPLIL